MNLRGIANSVSCSVNPNQTVTVLRSSGYTIGPGRKQIPTYAEAVTGSAQIQALNGNDLKQLDGLNIQGFTKAIFLTGSLAGVLRPAGTGGDIIQIETGPDFGTWLVTKVLESWPTWTKAAITRQTAA